MSIEIYPSYKNNVIAPVINDKILDLASGKMAGLLVSAKDATSALTYVNLGLRNLNQPAFNVLREGTAQTFIANGEGCFADNFKIRLATYLLRMVIFNSLAAKYIQVPLLFPIQTVQINDFTQPLQECDDVTVEIGINTANTLALKHCDALFSVFRNGEYAITCFENHFIEYQFNIDGKMYPLEMC